MNCRRLFAFVALCAMLAATTVVGAAGAAPPPTEASTAYQKVFTGTNGQVQTEIGQEIDRTRSGDKVYINIFDGRRNAPIKAHLVNAIDRGVKVKMLVDRYEYNNSSGFRNLIKDLEAADNDQDELLFQARVCTAGCEGNGKDHEKFVYAVMNGTASGWAAGSKDDFVIASTGNWMSSSTKYEAALMFNADWYSGPGDFARLRWKDMWDAMSAFGVDGTALAPAGSGGNTDAAYDGFNAVHAGSGAVSVIDWGANPSATKLQYKDWINNATGGSCEIRMAMGSWDDSAESHDVVDALRKAKYRGCTVDVIVSTTNNSHWNTISGWASEPNQSGQSKLTIGTEFERQIGAGSVHAKMLLIDHSAANRRSWVGSANVTNDAVEENDEISFRSENATVYNHLVAYYLHLDSLE